MTIDIDEDGEEIVSEEILDEVLAIRHEDPEGLRERIIFEFE